MIKNNISEIMKKKKMNITQLSEESSLHRNIISRLINNKTNGIDFSTMNKLCKALECQVGDLFIYIEE
ncbi:helix-turn-helix domain-containing protein [Alkalihalobacillus trypoxylicola]|uniref:Cro/Cl family transcriptional regulator n=1 Tax=Alkalihalobacillus trypoxylicola TaxID=519424 RepID=A0A161PKT4_9BACI|nr:helix-turn-helix transcriptional regulator [Alkalihalobacillus trypoxylicola]KYG34896.1 Cro/Cl family transcriptional regulator [Alkalihalobacillus trypoxylicola]